MNVSGLLNGVSGPPGATYSAPDGFATFGFLAPGAVGNCFDQTGNCYSISVSNPATRPAQHWDMTAQEEVAGSTGNTRYRTFHIGKSFADVPTTSPQYKFVETIFHNGVTAGCTTGNYCPDQNVTRAQMAVFLMRSKHGSTWNPPPAQGTVFTDVPANAFAAAWIERMPLEGISTGCGGGMYCPDSNTTRAQMSVFLLRAQGGMSYNPPACTVAPFTDVPCSSPFAPWIAELVRRGIAAGCGNGRYCPDDPVTRGQMAVFLTTTFALQLYAP